MISASTTQEANCIIISYRLWPAVRSETGLIIKKHVTKKDKHVDRKLKERT